MAYCLRSFVQTLEQVLYPHLHSKNWVLDHDKVPQIQSLLENGTFLRDFFDKSSPLILEKYESTEDQIMDAAEKAEDALESHITSQILSNPEGQSIFISPPDLGEVTRVFDDSKKEVTKIMDAGQGLVHMSHPVPSMRYPYSKTVVVGVTEDLKQLNSRLTARASKLDIIPIVGMGGTGKTTLARILYDEYTSSKSHFDCCAWVTVSQNHDPQLILKTLIACMSEKASNEMSQQQNNDMIVNLYKILFGRRYLIVIDDIWSCKAWDDIQRAFPQESKGSRIILTTRESIVANYVTLNSHKMHLMNEDDSWELLRRIVFGEENCPREFEKVGKTIARNCGGLPLALQVIGGLLSHSQRTCDIWEHVAHEVSSLIAKADDQFSGIFSLSFANLPHYLKPCFLYMGVFPEDHTIRASKVIRMWVAEGFLYLVPDKSLEESAEIHLSALVDRNLIFVRERKSDGKVKSYGIHDLLRELCLKKALEKKFIYVKDFKSNILQDHKSCLRRVSVHPPPNIYEDEYGSLILTSLSRSIILTSGSTSDKFMHILCYKLPLLRVLNMYQSHICNLPKEFLQLVNLRYLVFPTPCQDLPRNISVFKNLQMLIVYRLVSIAILVDLPQLRHLKFSELVQSSDFPPDRLFNTHENLQSLSTLPLETLSGLLGKLPKLRKLVIFCDNSNDNVELTSFEELETLSCWYGFSLDTYTFNTETIFPHSLKKMKLMKCGLNETLLNAIGLLPELQVLKLQYCILENSTWEPSEDEFCQLEYLKIVDTNLEEWLATEVHFPVLRHLVFMKCDILNEIPIEIGGILTLETIEVDYCRPCVFESARRILEEQSQFGDTILKLRLGSALDIKEEEQEQEEGDDDEDDDDDDDDDDDLERVWYSVKSPKK